MPRTALFSRNQPGGVWTISDLVAHPGDIWFVDSGCATGADSAGYGQNPDAAFLTLDYAIGKCSASNGDVIYVLPGHTETFTAANGFDADVAGVKIIGLGWGDSRPKFIFGHANASVTVGAAGVWLENLRFCAGITAVLIGVTVETLAHGLTVKDCEFYWGGTTTWDFVDMVSIATPCDRVTFDNCRFLAEPAVAGCATGIKFVGPCSNMRITRCEFMGDMSTACVNGITALSEGLMFLDNIVHNTDAGEPYLEVFAGTTGVISNTHGLASAATVAANAVANAMVHVENYVANTTGTIPIIKGAGGSPSLDAD
jgi:hypothetical protein